MLDWTALLPPSDDSTPDRIGLASPELGEIPPVSHHAQSIEGEMGFETGSGFPGRFDGNSPNSPISPEKQERIDTEGGSQKNAGGWGGQGALSARDRGGDDRVICHQCRNFWVDGGVCRIAQPDPAALVVAMKGYRPVQRLLRCRGFKPYADDPDQREGLQRWPWLKG